MEGLKEARKSHKQVMPAIEAKVFDKSPLRKIQLLESRMLKNDFRDTCDRYYGFRTEAGKSADPRIMRLLEFFRHLYYRRGETFQKIVPSGFQEEFEELFNKIGALFSAVRSEHEVKTIQRSLSAGSRRRQRSLGGGADLRLDRFKVRTVHADTGNGGDKSNNTSGDKKNVRRR